MVGGTGETPGGQRPVCAAYSVQWPGSPALLTICRRSYLVKREAYDVLDN